MFVCLNLLKKEAASLKDVLHIVLDGIMVYAFKLSNEAKMNKKKERKSKQENNIITSPNFYLFKIITLRYKGRKTLRMHCRGKLALNLSLQHITDSIAVVKTVYGNFIRDYII